MSRTVSAIARTALLGCVGFTGTLAAETLVGLRASDLHLISFDSLSPNTLTGNLTLTGFPTGVTPESLDFQQSNSTLLVVGRGPASTNCQMFSINPSSGAVTAQGAVFACPADFSDLDIKPRSSELRFISTSENFKVSSAGGKDSDTAAAFASGDPNVGEIPLIGGSAYDQNAAQLLNTTLFAIEAGNNVLVRVGSVNGSPNPPDTGLLTTLGALNVDVEADTLFDISGVSPLIAYMFSLAPAQNSVNGNLYKVDLGNGAATLVNKVGAGGVNLLGLTAAPGITLGKSDDDRIVLGGSLSSLLLLALAGIGMARTGRKQAAR